MRIKQITILIFLILLSCGNLLAGDGFDIGGGSQVALNISGYTTSFSSTNRTTLNGDSYPPFTTRYGILNHKLVGNFSTGSALPSSHPGMAYF